MAKGTPSMGRKSGRVSHIYCRRCGSKSYHISRKVCSACGFGNTATVRKYAWQKPRKK